MKQFIYLALFLSLLISGCKKDNPSISEVPPGLIPADLDTVLAQRLDTLLPRKNCIINHPGLFSDTIQRKIILTKESEVYVTFLEQSASYKNTFGWYSYVDGSKPAVDKIKEQILFPNVTVPPLSNGDKIQVGDQKFPAGTVIEFFLIVKGWQNGSIDYSGLTLYTDPTLNPNGFQQHILFQDHKYGTIILGFEDILQDDKTNRYWDEDFNDVLFSISDNIKGFRTTAIDTTKMAVL